MDLPNEEMQSPTVPAALATPFPMAVAPSIMPSETTSVNPESLPVAHVVTASNPIFTPITPAATTTPGAATVHPNPTAAAPTAAAMAEVTTISTAVSTPVSTIVSATALSAVIFPLSYSCLLLILLNIPEIAKLDQATFDISFLPAY